jgi:hypothetical protein
VDEERLPVTDVELAADIFISVWLQITRSILERGARPELTRRAVDAGAIGATNPGSEGRAGPAGTAGPPAPPLI